MNLSADSESEKDCHNKLVAILQITLARPGVASGGSQVVSMILAHSLASTGHQVILLSGTTDEVGAEFRSEGIRYRAAFQLTQSILENGEPDIYFTPEDWHLLGNCKVVFMFNRIYPLPEHIEPILILDTAAYNFFQSAVLSSNWSQMIVPSEYMFLEVANLLSCNGQANRLNRVHVVSYPLDPSRIGLSGKLPAPRLDRQKPLRFLFPHRADPSKGIKESLKLLSELVKLHDAILTVVMDHSPTAESSLYLSVNEAARSLNLIDKLEFISWRPINQMGKLYTSSDLTLCLGYFPEGFGLVSLESILCGTPVIARNVGAQTQLLPPDHGCFVAPEDDKELIQTVCSLLDDPLLRYKLSCGQEYIKRMFSTKSFLIKFRAIAGLH
jgi:glycosyltransferase involved in cell wall biosynthesis